MKSFVSGYVGQASLWNNLSGCVPDKPFCETEWQWVPILPPF